MTGRKNAAVLIKARTIALKEMIKRIMKRMMKRRKKRLMIKNATKKRVIITGITIEQKRIPEATVERMTA